jgi:CelD/BcsL family acetyltransferase involved in cellulose biosynthesis
MLRIEPRDIASIPRATWDRLAAATPWATPFAAWAFHRAWWDAYSDNAHEQTLVAVAPGAEAGADPVAIVPLMHRHEVEPGDAELHTTLRHEGGEALTPVPPTAKAIFFGASYHADYATILADPADLPAVADALVDHLAEANRPGSPDRPWDVIDLRRLRCNDPAGEALAAAFRRRAAAESWSVDLEREDACPVATLPAGGSIDDYLSTLGKKERHEIRRKVRRAEAAGEVVLAESREPLADLDAFIELHQRRWGADGLFPPTPGGDQSRVLFRRLFELFGPDGAFRLSVLSVGGRRIACGAHFETPDAILYYNAGVEPDARDLSPGVLFVERLARRAIERGRRRLDFLRGNEPYKYEWGAVDEPIQRLLVRRRVDG